MLKFAEAIEMFFVTTLFLEGNSPKREKTCERTRGKEAAQSPVILGKY